MPPVMHDNSRSDRVDKIIAFEEGELGERETAALIQSMIDDGTVWHLQGFYGRAAVDLIRAGRCTDTHGVLS